MLDYVVGSRYNMPRNKVSPRLNEESQGAVFNRRLLGTYNIRIQVVNRGATSGRRNPGNQSLARPESKAYYPGGGFSVLRGETMKPFNAEYSKLLDWLLLKVEASRGISHLYWRLMLWHAEREALG